MRYAAFLTCILFISLSACKKEKTTAKTCIESGQVPVDSVSGRSIGFANQNIPITVSYSWRDGCGVQGYFEHSSSGNITEVRAIGASRGCACTTELIEIRDTFLFKAASPGTYYLRFDAMNGNYLEDTVVVL